MNYFDTVIPIEQHIWLKNRTMHPNTWDAWVPTKIWDQIYNYIIDNRFNIKIAIGYENTIGWYVISDTNLLFADIPDPEMIPTETETAKSREDLIYFAQLVDYRTIN